MRPRRHCRYFVYDDNWGDDHLSYYKPQKMWLARGDHRSDNWCSSCGGVRAMNWRRAFRVSEAIRNAGGNPVVERESRIRGKWWITSTWIFTASIQ